VSAAEKRPPSWERQCKTRCCFDCDNQQDAYRAGLKDGINRVREHFADPAASLSGREVHEACDDLEYLV